MKKYSLSLIMLFCSIIPVSASVRHVPDEYATIQSAIEDCNNGDMVIVSPGTYVENIDFLGKNITVTSTDPENPDTVAATIIDGNNASSVVTIKNNESSEAILTGFTIKGGSGQNSAVFGSSSYCGAGIYCYNASPTIANNVISDNHGKTNTNNNVVSYGGGICCLESNAIITRNILKNNTAYLGAGVMTYLGNPIISNNIIHDNSALEGGGVFLYGGYCVNNTISGNSATLDVEGQTQSGEAGNLYFYEELVSGISNNIICNAKSGGGVYANESENTSLFRYNNVWGNEPENYYDMSDLNGKNGNISQNPLFVDNYHIGANSPCCNAGDPNYMPFLWQRDIDGQYAVMGVCIDIGADEVTDNARPVANAGDGQHFQTFVSNVILDGAGSYDPDTTGNLTYQWHQISGPNVVLSNPDTFEPNFAPASEDVYVFELIVYDGSLYSQPDDVMIIVGNRIPVAEAGEKQMCEPGKQVTLNGLGSYDPDAGDILSYSWMQISGPAGEFTDANTPTPHFIPAQTGEYVFELVVNDGAASSLPDTVTVICCIGSEPDAYGYSWIDSDSKWGPQFHWIDISNVRTKITGIENSLEECFGPFSLGFNFNFYGKSYNKCYIQSDGLISFGSEPVTYSNQMIPQADGYNNIIAWMWALLYPLDGSEICYKSFGDYFVIQFINYTIYSNNSIVNAEVILYKSGKIVIQYKDFSDDVSYISYTVGIENFDGTIGTQVAYNDYGYLHDELAIEFSLGGPYEPAAHAGVDQQYKKTELVTLDGTGSVDRDPNDVLTYQWTQTGGPSVVLSDSTAAKPTFMPAAEGMYLFQLVVSDGTYTSYPDEVSVFIGNRPPVADAGDNKACEPNQTATLDGSGSYDPDMSDVLTYSWTQVSGPAVNIIDADKKNPHFVPNARGEYVFELIVSDGIEQSQPDNVILACGIGSVPDDFGYRWIDNKTSWGPAFNWIDIQETGTQVSGIAGNYQGSFGPFPLGFDFNFYGNVYDQFYIQASGLISFGPEPIAYNNQSIPKADSYNNIIAWMWTLHYPQGKTKIFYQLFDNYTVVQFVDYDIQYGSGTVNAEVIMYKSGRIVIQFKDFSDNAYLYQHTIGIENADGTIGTQAAYNQSDFLHDELTIEFSPQAFGPIAQAGENQYFSKPVLVTLDGSNSYTYDPAGIISYHWRQTEGPSVTLSDPNAMKPTFMPEDEHQYKFELVVCDSGQQSEPDEVLIKIHNLPPVANAGSGQLFKIIPPAVTLNGTGSYDPLQDTLVYYWNQISGPAIELNEANSASPNFIPTEYGVYEFELIVSDGTNSSSPDTVLIVLDNGFFPVADAGQTVYSDGGSVLLNGTHSRDSDGQPEELIYFWEQMSGPSVVITDANSSAPLISGITQTDSIQTCEFELVVYDGQYLSFPDTVELKIVPKHIASPLRIESGSFDPNKPTIVFFNGGDGTYGSGSWSYSSDWLAKSNALCFYDYGPESESSRSYQYHGDILICYLSQIAPNYNKPIQTMGYSTGGQPAMDTAVRMNLTYKDARYAINRVTLLDVCCKDYTQDIVDFTTKPVDGEQSWVDAYIGTIGAFNPGSLCTKTGDDHSTPSLWYKNSLSGSDMNKFNGGIISGGYWSVIGPGKNFQLSRSHVNEQIYRYRWNGSQTAGSMSFYDEALYPGRMLGLVSLAEPYGIEDSNGIVLSCLACENAVGYQVLVGTDPSRVMDFEVVSDTPEPPDDLITEFPAEQFWWTVRAYDQYDSTIYADPKFLNLQMLSFPVVNLTSKTTYSTIQGAINNAVSGDQIQVDPGVYIENIDYTDKNIQIMSANPDDPAVIAETVIESDNDNPAVTISGSHDANCLLAGFSITGKNIGIYCSDFSSPVISKCRIFDNPLHGINLYSGCKPTIINCDIMNNSGCGINMELTLGRVKHENFPTIINCVISGNSQYGISKGKPTIINCTIADNGQGGIYSSEAIVANSIIYFNGDGSSAAQVTNNKSAVTYSDVQGSWSGTGNIDSDPLFADHTNGDYHLMSQTGRWDCAGLTWVQDGFSSPCIDAGDPNSDIVLEPVPNGSVINMGAYGGTNFASKSP
ncbi:MAG: right-handed parallel beta-helix repeat-containing protein [Sedimentisphaerales bacterium]|nr:right-handed parallel beta-helix repeat-containing protein [Sedimentisphaerales bacterium]